MEKFSETLNIAIDIETLSTQPTAAIISIAARVFTFKEGGLNGKDYQFLCHVSAESCAMQGMHFDMETIQWWKNQTDEAKKPFESDKLNAAFRFPIIISLERFSWFIDDIRKESPDNKILIWCQGTDFDIPILKHAYHKCLGVKEPWHHQELRDARTFIHGILGLIRPDVEDPYSLIPKNPNWIPHLALSDVDQLIWNVCHVQKMFIEHNRYITGLDLANTNNDKA